VSLLFTPIFHRRHWENCISCQWEEPGPDVTHLCSIVSSSGLRSRQWVGFKPKRASGRKWIYSGVAPPRSLIAAAMDLTVMCAAQRHRELIAHLATERTRLRKTKMVRI